MNYNHLVDSTAAIAKIRIESSNLTRDEKERNKEWIDFFKELSKGFMPAHQTQQSLLGLDAERIAFIVQTAHEYKMEKVVLIPVPDSMSTGSPLIKCYGHNSDRFFKMIGIQPISTRLSQEDSDFITECEKRSGVVIYDRNQLSEVLI